MMLLPFVDVLTDDLLKAVKVYFPIAGFSLLAIAAASAREAAFSTSLQTQEGLEEKAD